MDIIIYTLLWAVLCLGMLILSVTFTYVMYRISEEYIGPTEGHTMCYREFWIWMSEHSI